MPQLKQILEVDVQPEGDGFEQMMWAKPRERFAPLFSSVFRRQSLFRPAPPSII
jgi:hypothetical protein